MRNDDDPGEGGQVHLTQEQVDVLHRARVIYAFIDVVAERGYAATTVADVAGRAVMSSRTFYRLYDNKADAFCDMHRRLASRAHDCMCSAVNAHDDPRDKISAALHAVLCLVDEQPELGQAFVADGPLAENGRPLYHETLCRWLGEVESLLDGSSGMTVDERAGALCGVLRARLADGGRPPSEMMPVLGHLLLGEPIAGPPPARAGEPAQPEPPLKWDVVLGALADHDVDTLSAVHRRAETELASGSVDGHAQDVAAMAEIARVGVAGGLPAALAIVGHGQGSAAALPSRQAVRCLRYVAANPGSSGRGVLRGLGFRNESQVSRLLSGLANRGYLERTEAGGGAWHWQITDEGRQLLEEHFGG